MQHELTHRQIQTNGITMHIAEQGEGVPVILCHGFPGLWFNWRHQLPAIAAAGWHAVAPDMRGYGRTDAPDDAAEYDRETVTADLIGIVDALGAEQAVFIGHDFGAPVVWDLSMRYRDRIRAVIGLSGPYLGRWDRPPIEWFHYLADGRFNHLEYFQEVGPAEAELDGNPRRLLSGMFWALSGGSGYASWYHETDRIDALRQVRGRRRAGEPYGYLEVLPDPPNLPWNWLSPEEFEYYVAEYTRTGFHGGLNWYRVMNRSWEQAAIHDGAQIEVPAFYLFGSDDITIKAHGQDHDWLGEMKGYFTDLRRVVVAPGAGHYVQMEQPDYVNAALCSFLEELK